MPVIRIRERADTADGFAATVSVDDQGEYPITVTDPFGAEQEALLEWYFEEHLRFPFMRQVEAQAAAASPTAYGEALFQQVFGANAQLYARYLAGVQAGVANLRFAIAGSPGFHRLHWEALKDPALPRPLALDAAMVRKTLVPQVVPATCSPRRPSICCSSLPDRGSSATWAIAPSPVPWSRACARQTCGCRWTWCGLAPTKPW